MRRSSRKSEKRGISKKQQKEDARKRADEVLKNMTDEFANNENSNSNGSGYIPI